MTPDEIRNELLKTTFRFGKAHMGVPLGDIPGGEFAAMQVIHHFQEVSPEENGITAARLAAEVGCSPPAVSRLLNTLEEKEYVVRRTDPANLRRTRIALTEKGEEARRKGWERAADYFNRVTAGMGEEKMLEFLSLWKELVDIMERVGNASERR